MRATQKRQQTRKHNTTLHVGIEAVIKSTRAILSTPAHEVSSMINRTQSLQVMHLSYNKIFNNSHRIFIPSQSYELRIHITISNPTAIIIRIIII